MYAHSAHTSTELTHTRGAIFVRNARMAGVAEKLKRLREQAGLSVRGMAEELGIPASSYAAYEDTKRFKRDYLPMERALAFADVLSRHGVERFDVLALAGMTEAVPAHALKGDVARAAKTLRPIWQRLLELQGIDPVRAAVLVEVAEEALRISEATRDEADEQVRSRLAAQSVWMQRGLTPPN